MLNTNKVYKPAYVGGKILAVQKKVENSSPVSVTALPQNGIYYVYKGEEYQLLSMAGVTILAGATEIVAKEVYVELVPDQDVKLMFDTTDLAECVITPIVVWDV